MSLLLGAVADDMTGATDLALMLGSQGMPVVQYIGVPDEKTPQIDAAAAVVALKSRSIDPALAVEQSLAAARWLRSKGVKQLFFKYCSTFDSTPQGNIGPVAEALLDESGRGLALVCPAFPANARTVYMGHLFVGQELLSDSGMRHHPLTPMNDSNLSRLLQPQLRHDSKIALVSHDVVSLGVPAIRARLDELSAAGYRYAIADAISDDQLHSLGAAAADLPLITGGSGIAIGLPENFRAVGLLPETEGLAEVVGYSGPAAILSGSCSTMTQAQVARTRQNSPAFELDPLALARGEQTVSHISDWVMIQPEGSSPLVYSTANPEQVARIQDELGRQAAGELIEKTLGKLAAALVEKGVCKLVVAGGETSGAVIQELGVRALRIGQQIAPGVPWTISEPDGLLLALKSGNFGDENFFQSAMEMVK